ncbi:hypothetical protein RB595_002473 [Gaeumannomyces hyphopodioides]
MAAPGGTSALIAAFAFGIVVNGASAALFLNVKGHGATVFRDGLRLALTTFLLSAALWAQIGFIATTIDVTSASACSITSIVTALFDQLARFSIEQFMLWGMRTKNNSGTGQLVLQSLLAGRFIAGGVFVGFVRRQEQAVCAPVSSLLPVSVVVVALDAIIIVSLAARAFSVGLVEDAKSGVARSKAIVWILVGFAVWSATSVTLLLGLSTMDLTLRTALPAAGLTLLLILVTGSIDSFSSAPRQRQSRPPESPRRDLDTRDISTSDSQGYPPMRYEDLKREQVTMSEAYAQPREAPTAPAGSASMPQGDGVVIGRHGVPVQGALFPPLRSATEPVSRPRQAVAPQQGKRGLFDIKGGPAAAVAVGGRLAISKPILASDSEMNPLNKIPTMDLAAAAQQDKERREMWTRMQRESTLMASRPAPQPPSSFGDDGVVPATMLSPMPIGSAKTSSAQLSPGVEELRRRSPRQSPDPAEAEAEVPKSARSARASSPLREENSELGTLSPPPAPKSAFEKPRAPSPPRQKQPPFPLQRTKSEAPPRVIGAPTEVDRANMAPSAGQFQAPFYVPIRPSRQRTAETSEAVPEPQKTPLQRRPTIGLPGNPRARGMTMTTAPAAPAAPDTEIQNHQTIMFINNITYDDPSVVQKIIDGANTGKALDNEVYELELGQMSSNSVVNRPRPIPRKSEKDRVIFPAEQVPGHRRTKSGGSIGSRKSILQAYPGDPTQLPPLPPPPKSAGGFTFSRPHPNDTKSMTFDEKMNLFYPSGVTNRRRSSVPEIPTVPTVPPSNFFDMSEVGTQANDEAGTRTTKSSFKTGSVLDVDELAQVPEQGRITRDSVRSGGREGIDSVWIAGIEREEGRTKRPSVRDAVKRASSPVLPLGRESLWAESVTLDAKTPTDVGTTAWGSVHSPVAPVNIQRVAQPPKSTYIHARHHNEAPPVPGVPAVLSMDATAKEDDRESIHVTLDTSIDSSTDASTEDSPQTPVGADEDFMLSNNVFPMWHKRVGDDLLTFSERKEKMRSRMPPPTPLLLRAPSTRNPVVVKAAEPSPLESPDHALQLIQAQLQRIDQPNRDSVGSQGTRRLELLDNLEKEMDQWRYTKHDMLREARDSLSTIRSSPSIDSRPQSLIKSPAPPPVPPKSGSTDAAKRASVIMAERRAARRELLRSSSNASSKSGESSLPARSPASSVNQVASSWQQRLAEAQTEFSEHAPELLATRKQNFFALAQMGSPTPPDSDESDYESGELSPETHAVLAYTASSTQAAAHKTLWTPTTQVNVASASLLWSPPRRASESPVSDFAANLPVTSSGARALPRKADGPLAIQSNKLWQQSRTATKRYSTGLWQPRRAPAQPSPSSAPSQVQQRQQAQPKKQVPARSSTLKPPRRTRRITALPDILESPQPLPEKRGTLGIFQFPWGEKSDSATVQQPRHTMFAMPGTMTSGGGPAISAALEARSRQFEASEYSSSFFDDYDDEDLQDSDDDIIEEEDSGDDFDETTLWEIASLLKTDNVPSRNRAVPRTVDATSSVVDDYMDDASDLEEADEARESIIVGLDGMLPVPQHMEAAEDQQADILAQQLAISQLWTAAREEKRRSQHGLGLPHPDTDTWRQYDAVSETLRSQPRQSEMAAIESGELWQPAGQQQQQKKMKNKEVAVLLWSARNRVTKTRGDHGHGVAQPDAATWSLYDTIRETIRAVPRRSEPTRLESDQLWQPAGQQKVAQKAQPALAETALMWSARPAPKARGDHGKGIAQPDAATWSLYDTVKETIRALPRRSELASIESGQLWQPAGQQKVAQKAQPALAETALMWSARPAPKARGDHGKGIAQPDAAIWSLYDTVKETIRALPRRSELASIESGQLWQPAGQQKAAKATQPTAAKVALMWSARPVPKARGDHGKGVAQPDEETWNRYDTVKETIRALPRQSELVPVESNQLWQPLVQRPKTQKTKSAKITMMWSARPATKARGDHSKGVAYPDAATWSLYDTVKQTARALPRQSELASVESDQLWQSRPANAHQNRNWIESAKHVQTAAQPVSMWSVRLATKAKGEHSVGIAYPDATTWSLYDTVKQTARALPRKSDPASVESDQLWQSRLANAHQERNWIEGAKQTKMAAQHVPMWTAATVVAKVKGEHGKGLAQPDAATWAMYDVVRETARSQPRKSELMPVESNQLWQSRPVNARQQNWIAGAKQVKMAAQPVSMWTVAAVTPVVRGEHGKGVAQPDAATWSLYNTVQETARSQPRQSDEPLVIESSRFWQPSSQAKKQTPVWILAGSRGQVKPAAASMAVQKEKTVPLWSTSAAFSRSKGDHGKGVAHPDAATWALYDTVRETARSKPRQSEEPLPIQSDRLWQPAGLTQPATALMWTASVKTSKAHSKGLPQPDEATWRRYDVIKETARAKARPAEPATIESTHMWIPTPPQSPKEVVDWSMAGTMAKTPASPASLPSPVSILSVDANEQATTGLWIAAAPVVAPMATTGLFQLQPKISDTRSTSESPAAISMVRKARSPELKALDKLTSTDLWVAAAPTKVERNWMSMPQAFASTKTSSLPKAAHTPVMRATPADWSLAVQQAVNASYPPEWMPRWAASAAEWDAALEQAVTASAYPAVVESKKVASRPSATPADWALAAQQAALSSYPPEWMPRWAASADEWVAAVAAAVDASYPTIEASEPKPVVESAPARTMITPEPSISSGISGAHEAFSFVQETYEPQPQLIQEYAMPQATNGYEQYQAYGVADQSMYQQQFQGYGTPYQNLSYAMPQQQAAYGFSGYAVTEANEVNYGFNYGFDQNMAAAVVEEPAAPQQPQEQDAFIMAQIEALEQERLFTEQMLSRPQGMGEAVMETPDQAPQSMAPMPLGFLQPMPLQHEEPQAEAVARPLSAVAPAIPIAPVTPETDDSSAPKGNRVTLLY